MWIGNRFSDTYRHGFVSPDVHAELAVDLLGHRSPSSNRPEMQEAEDR